MLPEERFERIERKVEFLVKEGARIDQRIAVHSEQIADLGAFLLRLGHSLENLARETREQFRVTDERLRSTDERLNILIGIVERYFSR